VYSDSARLMRDGTFLGPVVSGAQHSCTLLKVC